MAVLLLADGRFEGDGLLRDLQNLAHLVHGHPHLGGDLLRRGVVTEGLEQLAGDADDLVDGLDHVDGDADGARLVGDGAGDGLTDPPRRVGGELVALGVVELLDRLDETQIALLNEVKEEHSAPDVALGDGDDQTQVRLGELLLGLFTVLDCLFERGHFLLGKGLAGLLGGLDARLGVVLCVHPGRERDLLVGGEQGHLADLLEVHTHRIVDGEAVHQIIGVDQLLLLDLGDGLQRRLVQIVRLDDAADVVDAESVERVVDALASVVVEVELVEDLGDLVGIELTLLLALGKEVAELFTLLQLLGGGQSGEDLFVQQRGLLLGGLVLGLLALALARVRGQQLLHLVGCGEQGVGLRFEILNGEFLIHVAFLRDPVGLCIFRWRQQGDRAPRRCAFGILPE